MRRPHLLLLLTLALATALFAGCGSDDGGSDAGAGSGGDTTASEDAADADDAGSDDDSAADDDGDADVEPATSSTAAPAPKGPCSRLQPPPRVRVAGRLAEVYCGEAVMTVTRGGTLYEVPKGRCVFADGGITVDAGIRMADPQATPEDLLRFDNLGVSYGPDIDESDAASWLDDGEYDGFDVVVRGSVDGEVLLVEDPVLTSEGNGMRGTVVGSDALEPDDRIEVTWDCHPGVDEIVTSFTLAEARSGTGNCFSDGTVSNEIVDGLEYERACGPASVTVRHRGKRVTIRGGHCDRTGAPLRVLVGMRVDQSDAPLDTRSQLLGASVTVGLGGTDLDAPPVKDGTYREPQSFNYSASGNAGAGDFLTTRDVEVVVRDGGRNGTFSGKGFEYDEISGSWDCGGT